MLFIFGQKLEESNLVVLALRSSPFHQLICGRQVLIIKEMPIGLFVDVSVTESK